LFKVNYYPWLGVIYPEKYKVIHYQLRQLKSRLGKKKNLFRT
jgi:hypothetical protein